MMISKYISYDEATKSPTAIRLGIKNDPGSEELENMKYVGEEIHTPVREFAGGPVHASSFYRCDALNKAIGGSSKTSQHKKGEAIDMDCDTYGYSSNRAIFDFIRENLIFDQLILEYPDPSGKPSWIHASKRRDGKNRMEVLVKLRDKYISFSSWSVGMV